MKQNYELIMSKILSKAINHRSHLPQPSIICLEQQLESLESFHADNEYIILYCNIFSFRRHKACLLSHQKINDVKKEIDSDRKTVVTDRCQVSRDIYFLVSVITAATESLVKISYF